MRFNKTTTLVLFACIASFPASACSSTSNHSSDTTQSVEPASRVPEDDRITNPLPNLRLPIQAYIEKVSETRKVTQATQQTINQCLDAMHVDYRLKLAPSSDAPALMAGRYGPVNSQQARYGYHFLTLLNYTAPKTEDQPSGDIEDAVHKCSANAEKKIPPLNDEGLPDKIKQQSYTESLNSAKTATAFKRWSGCMAKFGYSYSSPVAAMQDSKWNWSSKNPSQNEKAVALKDEECKQRATLIPTWFNAEVDLQKRQITLKKKELDAISNQIKLRAVAAHKILTEGSR